MNQNEYAKAQAAAGNPSAQLALAGLEASQIKFGNIQQGLKSLRSTPQNDKQMRGPKLSEGGYGLPPNPYSSYSTMASAQSGGQFSLPRRPLPAPSRPTTGRDIDPGFYKPMPKKPAPVDPGYVRPMPKKPAPTTTSGNVSRLAPQYYNDPEVQQMERGERARVADMERNNARNAAMAQTYQASQQASQVAPIYKRAKNKKQI